MSYNHNSAHEKDLFCFSAFFFFPFKFLSTVRSLRTNLSLTCIKQIDCKSGAFTIMEVLSFYYRGISATYGSYYVICWCLILLKTIHKFLQVLFSVFLRCKRFCKLQHVEHASCAAFAYHYSVNFWLFFCNVNVLLCVELTFLIIFVAFLHSRVNLHLLTWVMSWEQ